MICDVISRGDLEAYVFGEIAPSAARRVESHLFGCAECATEMRRLREERRLFRSRAETETAALPSFESVLARAEGETLSTPSFESVLARAEGEMPAIPSFESILERAESSSNELTSSGRRGAEQARSKHAVSNRGSRSAPGAHGHSSRGAAPNRSSRGVAVTSALLSLAAVLAGLWMRGAPPAPEHTDFAADTGDPLILREPGGECGDTPDDEDTQLPVSLEPTTSVDISLAPRRADTPPRAPNDPSSFAASCAPDPMVTSACGDPIAWCAAPTE